MRKKALLETYYFKDVRFHTPFAFALREKNKIQNVRGAFPLWTSSLGAIAGYEAHIPVLSFS